MTEWTGCTYCPQQWDWFHQQKLTSSLLSHSTSVFTNNFWATFLTGTIIFIIRKPLSCWMFGTNDHSNRSELLWHWQLISVNIKNAPNSGCHVLVLILLTALHTELGSFAKNQLPGGPWSSHTVVLLCTIIAFLFRLDVKIKGGVHFSNYSSITLTHLKVSLNSWSALTSV